MFRRLLMPLMLLLLASAGYAQTDAPPPDPGVFDPAALEEIDPADYPVLPDLTDAAREIFERGQAREMPRDPQMFSKVGDSMTASEQFLSAFGGEQYDLGEYVDLQNVVEWFAAGGAFDRDNYANALGFSTASALDSTWADKDVCAANESPLTCEYRVSNSAFALIMFGTNDVMAFDASLYDYFLRLVVLETMAADVVPILYTMPIKPEAPELSAVFNQIILKIAADYDLPVINLVIALEPLPNYGVDLDDTLHLTTPQPPATAATFTEDGLNAGYTVRNLVTLQALAALLTELDLLSSETGS
jgi:hypothetical protein